jgi:hypothetical protein
MFRIVIFGRYCAQEQEQAVYQSRPKKGWIADQVSSTIIIVFSLLFKAAG